MKVQNITLANRVTKNYTTNSVQKTKKQNFSAPQNTSPVMISFKGGNPNHLIITGAETQGLQKKGGVGTVMNEYFLWPDKQIAGVFPYNNAHLIYDYTGAEIAKDADNKAKISIHKFPADWADESLRGKYFWTGVNLDTTSLKSVMNNSDKYILLDLIASKKAPWDSEDTISLLKVSQKGRVNGDPRSLSGYKSDIFLVYNDTLGAMKEPYDTAMGGYSSKTLEELRNANSWASEYRASEYAQFDRIVVEFIDDVIANTTTNDGSKFNPKNINCSDGQTSLIPYFLKKLKGDLIEPHFTLHNGHPGYTGETSGRQMFQDLLLVMPEHERKQTIQNLVENKEYRAALVSGKENEFWAKYLPMLLDDNKSFTPVLAALQLAIPKSDKEGAVGFVKKVNTVSNGYMNDMGYNEGIGSGLHSIFKSMYKKGLSIGTLNAISDKTISAFEDTSVIGNDGKPVLDKDGKPKMIKRGYLAGYQKAFEIKYADGTTETIQPFVRFKESLFKDAAGNVNVTEETLKHVEETRLNNQINFFKRLTKDFSDKVIDAEYKTEKDGKVLVTKGQELKNLLINGLGSKKVELIGNISPEVVQQFESAKAGNAKAPTVFVSWGRLDDQKAMDEVMNAFDKFRKTNPDAVLVLGGEAGFEKNGDMQPCSKKIIGMAQEFAKKHEGRFVFMNGFAPGKVLSGVADAAIFPSRWAPCELTDVENKKFLSRVIVTNIQGLADKNFDPEIEADKPYMDGYKTKTGWSDITIKDIEADSVIKDIYHRGVPEDNIVGFDKIYADAKGMYTSRIVNSGSTLNDELINNYKEVLKTILDDGALAEADKVLEKLKDGTSQAEIEDGLLRLIFNKDKLKDKNVKLKASLDDEQLNIMKKYLADVRKSTRIEVEYAIVNKGCVDEKQITAAKKIFNFDPVLNFIRKDGKLNFKYEKLVERCKNELLENELVHCMRRCVNETRENMVTMLKNHYLLNTDWKGNSQLTKLFENGVPISTYKAYQNILESTPDAGEVTRTDNEFLQKLLDAITPKNGKANTSAAGATVADAVETAADAAKEASKGGMSKGMKIALGAGAALLALGGAYYAMKKPSDEKVNAHGDTFKPSTPTSRSKSHATAAKIANSAQKTAAPAQKGANPAQKQQALNPYLATK